MHSSMPWALTWNNISLNIIFYTHVEHSPTKTIYVKYYTDKQTHAPHTRMHARTHTCTHARAHTHTHIYNDSSRNWVPILVGMKILWEEEGFQFGFKRWKGWAVSKVLWWWIPKCGVQSKRTPDMSPSRPLSPLPPFVVALSPLLQQARVCVHTHL